MALVNASRIGNISVVRKLIADGEDLEQTEEAAWEGDEDGTTALMWASMNSHQDVVELLLTSGANPEARDEDQMTALMLAGMEGHREVIWKLINAKAEVNAQDSDGRTALHHSAMYGHAAVVGLLLSADADIEVKDTAGYTPLMTAKLDDYYIVMGMLLSCGAQPRLPSGEMTKEEIDEATLRYSDWVGSEVFDRLDVHNLEELDSYLTAHSGDSSHLSSKKLEARGAEAEALKQINLALAARDAERLTKAITYAEEVSDKYDGFVHAHYVEEARDSLQTMAYENEKREDPGCVRMYVVPREVITEFRLGRKLISFRDLMKQDKLRVLNISRVNAIQGSLRTGDCKVLAISYPWQGLGDPDSTNDRLDAVAEYLEENADIDAVWWDWCCVPQFCSEDGELTAFEKAYFKDLMEEIVWLIYLTAKVLCIMSPQSMIRFWPQLEFYLSTRAITPSGLQPSFERLHVKAIQSLVSSAKEQEAALSAKWASVSQKEAIAILRQCPVTLEDDKIVMLNNLPDVEVEFSTLVKDLPSPTLLPWRPHHIEVATEVEADPSGPMIEELKTELEALQSVRGENEKLRAKLTAEKEMREASSQGKDAELKKAFEEIARLGNFENELLAAKRESAAITKDLETTTAKLRKELEMAGANLIKETATFNAEVSRLESNLATEVAKSKALRNQIEDFKGKVRVFARCRPMADYEKEKGCVSAVDILDDSRVEITTDRGRKKEFEFNKIFAPDATQDTIFAECETLIQSVIDGFNVCLFAYGQTGSGKTFTMTGKEDAPGLTPRAVKALFERLESLPGITPKIQSYCFELYNNDLVDLYHKMIQKDAGKKKLELNKLEIKLDAKKMVVVKGATTLEAANAEELLSQFEKSNQMRHVGATLMNADSSRSHSIFTILVEVRSAISKRTTTGKLSLVDLAGSERMNKTGATGERMKEALSINKSLSALGDVIGALSANESFIPYRNNKLTQLMQDSLGGNAKTLMFVNFSPADYNRDESIAALTYAQRVKAITNNAIKNAESEEITSLKSQVVELQAKLCGVVEVATGDEAEKKKNRQRARKSSAYQDQN